MIQTLHPAKVALVGAGGSGKSTLAAALGHKLRAHFEGRIHWFRIGAWDVRTLAEMMALRLGVRRPAARSIHSEPGAAATAALLRGSPLPAVAKHLRDAGPSLIVLDNHEDDAATAALLDALRGANVSWVITARRSLLSGVPVFPVVPPLVNAGKNPFPRLAPITRALRWNPVALDLADALVEAGVATVPELSEWLTAGGIDRVRPVDHEDDLPEVALLVDRAWRDLSAPCRRMLGVLAHMGGDHMDVQSLATLSRTAEARDSLARLEELRLVQEPMRGRFTLHATVRHAVMKRTKPLPDRLLRHYVALLTEDPARIDLEQTHLFAAMDHAQAKGDLSMILGVTELAWT